MIKRHTTLSENFILLCRFLRERGYGVGLSEESEILKLIDYQLLADKDKLKDALKVILCRNQHQFNHFDDDFDDFWFELNRAADSKIKQQAIEKIKKSGTSLNALKDWLYGNETNETVSLAHYSPHEKLSEKEFSAMDEDELRLINQALKRLSRKVQLVEGRLRQLSKSKDKIDLKHTMRSSLRLGGELIEFEFSRKKPKRLKLLLLCDVSRSMELYSRFFIHLIYAFQQSYDRINTWVFSTKAHNVSDLLGSYQFDKAYRLISERVPHWSGGTQIGACLSQFNREKNSWSVDRNTVVFVLSDGWDTGDPELLSQEMRNIYRKCRKLIWLNPLAGNPGFIPEVAGLKSALPFVDIHASCHNLESLKVALNHIHSSRRRLRHYNNQTDE